MTVGWLTAGSVKTRDGPRKDLYPSAVAPNFCHPNPDLLTVPAEVPVLVLLHPVCSVCVRSRHSLPLVPERPRS